MKNTVTFKNNNNNNNQWCKEQQTQSQKINGVNQPCLYFYDSVLYCILTFAQFVVFVQICQENEQMYEVNSWHKSRRLIELINFAFILNYFIDIAIGKKKFNNMLCHGRIA